MDIRRFLTSPSGFSSKKSNLAPKTPPRDNDDRNGTDKDKTKRASKRQADRTKDTYNNKKKKVAIAVSDDDESDKEDPVPSKVAKQLKEQKIRKKKAHVIHDSSSDDDLIAGASASPVGAEKVKKFVPVRRSPRKHEGSPTVHKITPADFFGGLKATSVSKSVNKETVKSPKITEKSHEKTEKVDNQQESSNKSGLQPKKEVHTSPIKKDSGPNFCKNDHDSAVTDISTKKQHTPTSGKRRPPPLELTTKTSPPRKSVDNSLSEVKIDRESTGRMSHGGGMDYHQYLQRDGPRHLGEKEPPQGAENCLRGLTFVITGVLDYIDRDDAKVLIEKYGGKVMTSVSRKTSYVVVGREAGQSKLNKIREWHLKTLDENELFDLIQNSPAKSTFESKTNTVHKVKKEFEPKPESSNMVDMDTKSDCASKTKTEQIGWVDKYKPTTIKQIIGQQGDKSPMNKLLNWLRNWHRWHMGPKVAGQKKGRPPPWKSDDGASFKAVLLSGPPGIGKTTTAHLCCKELSLSFVELNASDARNKKSLELHVKQLITSKQIDEYFIADAKNTRQVPGENSVHHVLVMDEVDGMSGNQDRAGMQELILLIKSTKIPIICICNDRQSQKVRSLANYCFDLRFYRPRMEQIRGRIMTISCQEGMKLQPQSVEQLIEGANHDIRQVIQHLSLLSVGDKSINFDQARKEAQGAKKDIAINIFEAARQLLAGGSDSRSMSLIDKTELFFLDYSLMPLFVQENYLNVVPHKAKNMLDRMQIISDVAESLCWGDITEKLIRTSGSWSLLNEQAMFSSVIPSELLNGHLKAQLTFPSWLGKNSTQGKRFRLLQQLQAHMCIHVSSDATSLQLDYIPSLRRAITQPLIDREMSGVSCVVKTYEAYDLTRDDSDAIFELGQWPGTKDPVSLIPSKVKAAVTRTYNKEHHRLPYSTGNEAIGKTKKKRGPAIGFGVESDENVFDEMGNPIEIETETNADEEDIEDEEDMSFVKLKKPKPSTSTAKTSQSRAKKSK